MNSIEFNAGVFRASLCFILIFLVISGEVGYEKLYFIDHNAVPTFRFFGLGQIPLDKVWIIRYVLVAALMASAFGVKTRAALLVSACAYFLYYGNQLGFSKSPFADYVYHSKNLAFFTLLMLSVARETTVFALDNLKNNGWKGFEALSSNKSALSVATSIQLLIGIAYLGSAITKLVNDVSWLDGYTLQASLWKKYMLFDNELGYKMAHEFLLCKIFSYFTVFFELTFIIGVFIKRVRWIYILAGALFHLNIYLTMNINFGFYFYGLYLIFIEFPWKQGKEISTASITKVWKIRELSLVAILIFQFVSVIANYEAWPISSFGVFVRSTEIDHIRTFRYGIKEGTEYSWLEDEDLPRSKTNVSSLIRRSIKAGRGDDYKRIYTEEVKNHLKNKGKDPSSLVLFECFCEDSSQPKLKKTCIPLNLRSTNVRSITKNSSIE